MRCSCCDKQLTDREATARFVNEDKTAPVRYVEMCKTCQGFLPDSVKISTRSDLEDTLDDSDYEQDTFDYEIDEDDYGYED